MSQVIRPPKPLGDNWAYFPRLNEWRVKHAPQWRQLQPLQQRRETIKAYGTGSHKPSLPQGVLIAAIEFTGREWVTIPEMQEALGKAHVTVQKAFAAALADGKLIREKRTRFYGERKMTVDHYKLKL